jgi:hypothetical protein
MAKEYNENEIKEMQDQLFENIDILNKLCKSTIIISKDEDIKLHLNCKVKVKLTNNGKSVASDRGYILGKSNDDGYIESQLWELMKVFGSSISSLQNGEQPFEDNMILLPANDEIFNIHNDNKR